MKDTFVKVICQKTFGDNLILTTVVPRSMIGGAWLPNIFQAQGYIPVPTIYTGTYPTLRVIPESLEDITEQFEGMGLAGIITNVDWYISHKENSNELGINLSKKDLTPS